MSAVRGIRTSVVVAAALLLAACTETIVDVIDVDEVAIEMPAGAIVPGQSVQLNGKLMGLGGENLTGRTVAWSSSNAAVATVSGTGLLTGVAPGLTEIAATTEGVRGALPLVVNFPAPTLTEVAPTTVAINQPVVITLKGTGFLSGTVGRLNGTAKATTVVSGTELRMSVGAEDVRVAGAVEITVFNPTPGGGISQKMTLTAVSPCELSVPIAVGQSINADLSAADCARSGGYWSDRYRLTITSTTTVSITHISSAFDAMLFLYDAGDRMIASDDDGGGALNSRLNTTLQPGTYYAVASSFDRNATGAYALTVREAVPPCVLTSASAGIAPGQTVNGTIAATDCTVGPGWPADVYRFTLATARSVTVTQTGTGYQPFVLIANSTGVYIGGGTSVNPSTSVLTMPLQPGTYFVVVTGDGGATGPYTVTMAP